MRTEFGAQLAALTAQLAEICRMAGEAMEQSTRALLHADLILAEQVIGQAETLSWLFMIEGVVGV